MRRRLQRVLLWLGLAGAVVYALLAVGLAASAPHLLFPIPTRPGPGQLPAGIVRVEDCGGKGLLCLYAQAQAGRPTVVFFHSNGNQVADLVPLMVQLQSRGLGMLVPEYPGYSGTPGSPSEESLETAASMAIAHLQRVLGVPASRTVLVGRSLGTGVAVELARSGAGARLVLVSPYTSIDAVGQQMFPFMPVRWLNRDHFDSLAKAPRIRIPTLVLHGTADRMIAFAQGQALAAHIPGARLLALPGVGHNDVLDYPEVVDAIAAFALDGTVRPIAQLRPLPASARRDGP